MLENHARHAATYAGYDAERRAPHTGHRDWNLSSGAIVEISTPPGRRIENDGVVLLGWATQLAPKDALDRACESHEDWLDRLEPQQR